MVLVTVIVLTGSRSVLQGNALFPFTCNKPCYTKEIWGAVWISGNLIPLSRFQVSNNKFLIWKIQMDVLLLTSWTWFQNPADLKIFTIYKIVFQHILFMSRDSLVGIATGYGLDDQGGGNSSPGRVKNVYFSISSRPALGSTQPPIKWVPGALSRG
jgi:hypothetical protein